MTAVFLTKVYRFLGIRGCIAVGLALALGVALWRADGLADQVDRYRAAEQAAKAAYRAEVTRRATIAADYEREASNAAQIHTIREREIETIFRDVLVPAECAAPDSVRRVLSEAVAASNSAASGEPVSPLPALADATGPAD